MKLLKISMLFSRFYAVIEPDIAGQLVSEKACMGLKNAGIYFNPKVLVRLLFHLQ